MINNPMTSEYAKENIGRYPGTLQSVFNAIDTFAYDAAFPIEGPLGEGHGCISKRPFDYQMLVRATLASISRTTKDSWSGLGLRRALADAALTDTELDRIVKITEEEALARINHATSEDRRTFREHGHHGRQYIARNTVERVMKEVLPLQP